MSLGFANLKDILDVLLVPLSVGLLAVLWPTLAARKRRANFEVLIRRELEEAAPYIPNLKVADIRRMLPDPSSPYLDEGTPWPKYLTRRFLHEEIISKPVDNTDFVLSLKPELSYNLSQMWTMFYKADAETRTNKKPSKEYAEQFCWYLGKTCRFLDCRHGSDLSTQVCDPWARVVKSKYPKANVGHLIKL
jgi:hypothetical protein